MTVPMGRAVQFSAPEAVDVVPIEPPEPPAGKLLVKTTVSAISAGTELLLYHGQVDPTTIADEELPALDGTLSYPIRYGYAATGTVSAVGDGVDAAWLGRTVFAFNPHESHFLAAPDDVLVVPEGVDTERAALFANTETAVNFMLDAAPRIGERVAVFGQGVIGLLTTALLARSPAETVVAVEPHARRRELARELGADVALDPTQTDVETAVHDRFDGVDLAIEVSGRPSTLETAVEATRYDGRVLVGSWYGTKRETLGFGDHHHRGRISIESSQVSTIDPMLRGRWDVDRRRETAWRQLQTLGDDLDGLVTHRTPVEDAPKAYRRLAETPAETLQTLLTYRD